MIRFALNTAVCQSTGYTPAYLTFGRELRHPDDVHRDMRCVVENENFVPEITPYLKTLSRVLQEARDTQERAQDRNKHYVDKGRRPATFEVGDKVLVSTHVLSNAKTAYTAKFAPKRDGPYVVVKCCSPTTYEIATLQRPDKTLGKYHVSCLTNYVNQDEGDEIPEPVRELRGRGRPRLNKEAEPPQLERPEALPNDKSQKPREEQQTKHVDGNDEESEPIDQNPEQRRGTRLRKARTRTCCQPNVCFVTLNENVKSYEGGECSTDNLESGPDYLIPKNADRGAERERVWATGSTRSRRQTLLF